MAGRYNNAVSDITSKQCMHMTIRQIIKVPGGKDGVVSSEPMNIAVFKRQSHDTLALAVFHYQICREVLDVVVCVVLQRLSTTVTWQNYSDSVKSS